MAKQGDRFESMRRFFQKEGFPHKIIDNLEGVLRKLYNKETGKIELDDEERFNELITSVLKESSDILTDILRATDLLDKEVFRPFYFSPEETDSVLDETEGFIAQLAKEDETKVDGFLITDKYPEERAAYGEILYRSYVNLITPSLVEDVERALAQIIESSSDLGEIKLAKTALDSFSFMPGKENLLMMYLFTKSLVINLGFHNEIEQIADSQEEADLAIKGLEDSLYAALAMGEERILEEKTMNS